MPNSILIPTAQNLPDGFCPTNWQATVNAFAAAMRVTLPTSASQIIVQSNPPGSADHDKIWFQEDGNGQVLSIRSWNSATNAWERVDEEQYYFNDIGTTNAIEINSANIIDAVSSLSDVVGRLLIVKVANANSATAVTLELDGLTPTAVKKYGSEALAIGNIEAGMICIFMYDGTNFQLLNPKYAPPQGSSTYYYRESPQLLVPDNNLKAEWIHGFSPNKPTYVSAFFVCLESDAGYNPGDELDVFNLFAYMNDPGVQADLNAPAYALSFDSTKAYLVTSNLQSQAPIVWNKTSGNYNIMVESKWRVVFKATRIVPL
jgi:hypothetical protein